MYINEKCFVKYFLDPFQNGAMIKTKTICLLIICFTVIACFYEAIYIALKTL